MVFVQVISCIVCPIYGRIGLTLQLKKGDIIQHEMADIIVSHFQQVRLPTITII